MGLRKIGGRVRLRIGNQKLKVQALAKISEARSKDRAEKKKARE